MSREKNEDKYKSQKRYLAQRKQLRVWVETEKYEMFKSAVAENGESIYGLINKFIDEYLKNV